MVKPINWGGMLEPYLQPLKERLGMLPLGQYEDGSVRLAWPGMLADTFSKGMAAAETPIPAINDDQSWADKSAAMFDMTSLAPVGGYAAAMGGALDNALGSAGKNVARPDVEAILASLGERNLGSSTSKSGLGLADVTLNKFGGGEAAIIRDGSPIGRVSYALNGDELMIESIHADAGSNSLGLSGIRDLREAFRGVMPDVKRFSGDRSVNLKTGAASEGAQKAGIQPRSQSVDFFSNSKETAAVPLAIDAAERAQPVLASRDMQQMARSLGYDPQRVKSWASQKVNELSRSTWDSDKQEAARLGQLLQEIEADPNALSSIRQRERAQVEQGQAARQQQQTERPIASRDGYQIVRRDDPYVGGLDFSILSPDGQPVGNAKMSAAGGQVENPEIGWVGIDEAHRRKGLASWLYDEIERDIGQKIWPSPELISPEIEAFWQKRDPERLARMRSGTYANSEQGAAVPLALDAAERAQPQGIRGYRGGASEAIIPSDMENPGTVWSSTSPDVANFYAERAAGYADNDGLVMPLDMRGNYKDEGPGWLGRLFGKTQEWSPEWQAKIDAAVADGYDGVRFRNVSDSIDGVTSDWIATAKPGTVYSATTGDLLYSNAPTGAAIPAGMEAAQSDDPQTLTTANILRLLMGGK